MEPTSKRFGAKAPDLPVLVVQIETYGEGARAAMAHSVQDRVGQTQSNRSIEVTLLQFILPRWLHKLPKFRRLHH